MERGAKWGAYPENGTHVLSVTMRVNNKRKAEHMQAEPLIIAAAAVVVETETDTVISIPTDTAIANDSATRQRDQSITAEMATVVARMLEVCTAGYWQRAWMAMQLFALCCARTDGGVC